MVASAYSPHPKLAFILVFFVVVVNFCFFKMGFLCVSSLSWNSLCGPGWPHIHRDPPAPAFQVLGLKACPTMPNCVSILNVSLHTWIPCDPSLPIFNLVYPLETHDIETPLHLENLALQTLPIQIVNSSFMNGVGETAQSVIVYKESMKFWVCSMNSNWSL